MGWRWFWILHASWGSDTGKSVGSVGYRTTRNLHDSAAVALHVVGIVCMGRGVATGCTKGYTEVLLVGAIQSVHSCDVCYIMIGASAQGCPINHTVIRINSSCGPYQEASGVVGRLMAACFGRNLVQKLASTDFRARRRRSSHEFLNASNPSWTSCCLLLVSKHGRTCINQRATSRPTQNGKRIPKRPVRGPLLDILCYLAGT